MSEQALLTDEEHTALILASSRENVLHCAFGPSGAWLQSVANNQWAFDLLAQMRTSKPSDSESSEAAEQVTQRIES